MLPITDDIRIFLHVMNAVQTMVHLAVVVQGPQTDGMIITHAWTDLKQAGYSSL